MRHPLTWAALVFGVSAGAASALRKHSRSPSRSPSPEGPGRPKRFSTRLLETGAHALQHTTPLSRFHTHLVGFHPMKSDPDLQMEAHHFCRQVTEDFMECILFDGDGPEARLNGVEYIISKALFDALPEEEKQYWHPHNFEILSGLLVAPRLPPVAEKALMRTKINSYGKTWHFQMVEGLPRGAPCLAWSFNHEGEIHPELVASRDARTGIRTERKRKERDDLRRFATLQRGEDLLRDRFGPTGWQGAVEEDRSG